MARTVKIVHLPDLPERGGDVSDWLNAGGTAEKLQELAEGAMTLFGRTPPSLTCVADVEREETVWLWHNRIPLRKLTLIEGDPGEGKTWLTHVLAANITRGWPLPDDEGNTFEREPGGAWSYYRQKMEQETLSGRDWKMLERTLSGFSC